MYVAQSAPFEAVIETGTPGLVGTIEVAIIDNDGTIVFGPSTADIAEEVIDGQSTGIYNAELTAPAVVGQYTIVWSTDGSYASHTVTVEDLVVTVIGDSLPAISDPEGGVQYGPCSAWTTIDDITECCTIADGTSQFETIAALTLAATTASQILYDLSGKRFVGVCTRTVRPCELGCSCGYQVLSRGHLVGWDGSCWAGSSCGCEPLSEVKLSGYPVRTISQVKIDGDILAASEYRLDRHRYLVRLNGAKWPNCQSLDLPDSEDGTWSVTYTFGQNPPQLAQDAAAQLACEIYKNCNGMECALPTGATRITRQGITIERTLFARDAGAWRTGMSQVDGFLNSVNPDGLRRRPVVWAPGRRYPRRVGT